MQIGLTVNIVNTMKKVFVIIAALLFTISIKAQSIKNLYTFDKMQNKLELNISMIDLFEQRMYLLYSLKNDVRFDISLGDKDGVFVIKSGKETGNNNLERVFNQFYQEEVAAFSAMSKDEVGDQFYVWKASLEDGFIANMMIDMYVKDRQNNLCANADPFCTDNGQYQFPAGVNAGSGEPGPNYDCLSTTPNPAWYYMRMANAGGMTIHMYSTPSEDIDFCCWGPFDDPITPCPSGLTLAKRVSCSYSSSATENCIIPNSAQTGQYYILVITNYSNHNCNITFSKTAGTGTTDCSIMPPLVENGGPYCVGQTITLTGNAQSGATYNWSGPGGWSASGQNVTRPNCTMAMAGTYTCTIALNGQSSSADTQVAVYANPTANFNSTTVCVGDATHFTNTSSTSPSGQQITSYHWNFGDGGTSHDQNPTHNYAEAGTYTATLTVACGENTCTHTCQKTVTVNAFPVANAGNDQNVNYQNSATLSATAVAGASYAWTPVNKINGNPNQQTVQTIPLTEATTFTLTVTKSGCSDTDQVTVSVGAQMTANATIAAEEICDGNTTTVSASAIGGNGSYTYSWQAVPDHVTFSNPTSANTTIDPALPGEYTITCEINDGQTTLRPQVNLTVNPAENMDVVMAVCPSELPYVLELPDGTTQEFSEATGANGWHTTVPNQFGCNVNVSLYLTVNEVVENHFTEETCNEPYTYYDDGVAIKTLYQTCIFDTVYPYGDCEKHLIIDFTRHPVYDEHNADEYVSINYPEHHCMEYYWPSNGQTYTERGRYPYTFTTIHGCDSIVTLVLDEGNLSFTVDPGASSAMVVDTCKNLGGYYLWGYEELNTKIWGSGTDWQFNFQGASSHGCDSIGHLNLRLYERPSIDSIAGDKLVIPGIGFMPYVYEYKIEGIAGAGMDGDNPDYPTHPEDFTWEIFSYYNTPNRLYPDDPENNESSWQIGYPDSTDLTRAYVFVNAEGNALLKCTINTLCGTVSTEKFIYTDGYQAGESVDEYNYENMVNIFPNPTSGELYIGYSEKFTATPLIISIYNTKGEIIDQFYANTENNVTHYSMSRLPNGMYFVKFTGKDFVVTKKFVLNK